MTEDTIMPRTSPITGARTVFAVSILVLAACAADGPQRQPAGGAGAVSLVDYACDSGARIQASYPADHVAVVSYRDQIHEMTRARSASGTRYVADGLEWWTKGAGADATAILSARSARSAGGDSGERLERCRALRSAG